ncbi:DMT family transporter [Alkaliphilus hydrothermalis]|uniref:Drug/metabolite transporter (DMT)-like permease n=1 Tax=Alkaliphilus hydrothermalis TaxID=1482730 RepID=A0ABS2NRR7_9FIRM|nr:DMT family transporter [Alkaliphilus hydrothermalis]MBM7615660.1 drug/metabolite transporter (DMT)-like permease [Alkaliphilus hydrothermalis]
MIKEKKIYATLAILMTIFFWGISASSIKIALREVPPSTLAFIRFTIASFVLFVVNKISNPEMKTQIQDRRSMILCGLIGVTIYFIFENYGLSYINVANATILLASIPLFTIVAESIISRTVIDFRKGMGVILSMFGVLLVIGNSISVSTNPMEVLGSLLMIGASLSWVVYTILSKRLDGKYPTLYLSYQQNFYGAIFLIPFVLLEKNRWQPISLVSWGNIIYLALICSALCYYLYLYALKNLGPTKTNVYINLMPLIGVMAAFLILGEKLYLMQLAGGFFILLGIYVVNHLGEKPKPVPEDALITNR